MSTELYIRYRPKEFKDVAGQTTIVSVLEGFVKNKNVPHAILFTGPSGCGKTTLARILRDKLGCGPRDSFEINASESRGIDTVRELQRQSRMSPLSGGVRVWTLDEAQGFTKDAQQSLLKLLEDTPRRAYFFLATTEPQKLLKTIRTRCTEIAVRELGGPAMISMLKRVAVAEKIKLSEEVRGKLLEAAAGSARKALVILGQICNLADDEAKLDAISKAESEQEAIKICRALFDTRTTWGTMASIISAVQEEPEGLRRLILAYATTILLRGGKQAARAFVIVDAFGRNFFDSGRAGLAAAAYEVITTE